MSNDNDVISIDQPGALMHKYNEFYYSVSVPKPVLITEAEARIIADYFLDVIYTIDLCAGMGGWCHWEAHMYPYSHCRIGVLIESGLVTQKYIDAWWEANPLPEVDPDYAPWEDSDFSKKGVSDRASIDDLDLDDEVPF